MSEAYRCERCGELRDGRGWRFTMQDMSVEDYFLRDDATTAVELCPDCAAPYRDQLAAIAKTKKGR